MKKFISEFKEFALKGNMIDIAIGVIIGTAFNEVVNALVKQIFLPPLSLLTGGVSLEDRKIVLRESLSEGGAVQMEEISMGYGECLEVSLDFLIISFTVFIVEKIMNQLKNKAQDVSDKTVTTPKEIELLDKVASLLEAQNDILKQKNI